MAEADISRDSNKAALATRRLPPPPPPPRVRWNDPPVDGIYEEVTTSETSDPSGHSYSYGSDDEQGHVEYDGCDNEQYEPFERSNDDFHDIGSSRTSSSSSYTTPCDSWPIVSNHEHTRTPEEEFINEGPGYHNLNRTNRSSQNSYDYRGDYRSQRISEEQSKKIGRFKRNPKEFLDAFESTLDEMRTDEETFIIVHLLKKSASNSPILDGDLEQLALLACCNSPHVVKRALDALLNEIFLGISNFSRIRCRNMLQAERLIRWSFDEFLKLDHAKAKCQRLTTYAWLITFVLLKCSNEECAQIATELKAFDRTLDSLSRVNNQRNTFRYAIHLARETMKRLSARRDPNESLDCSIRRCANILNSRLDKSEVMKLGKVLHGMRSWLNLHICLVFLQDLPKLHQFQGNLKPIILIQMLIQDYRDRHSSGIRNALGIPNPEQWKFEILVYHVMLRLINTSENDDAITKQVLMGKQGCGGVFSTWSENKSKTTKDSLVMENLEKICMRVVFRAPPICFERLITCIRHDDEKHFIENLAILRLTSKYKDKVLEILPKSDGRGKDQRGSTYDVLMNGKKCVLKLCGHSKEEILKEDTSKHASLKKEIEIVKVLNALEKPCHNVVQLLGSSIDAPMHMIIERGFEGDLRNFLNRRLNFIEAQNLVHMALDVCKAMIFIHSQNIIHRDLRAEICFVFMQDGKPVVKIGDFHLATIAYSGPRSPASFRCRNKSTTSMTDVNFFSRFAVRWMAAETLQFGEFSTASDVWSFGVLLFEIFTFGCKPYVNMPSGLSLNSDGEVREYVKNGNRLEIHPRIPESIQNLIQLSMVDADHRPSFLELQDNLLEIKFEDDTCTNSAYFKISHNENESADIISPSISPSTGCIASGCFGDCLNASDIAVHLNVDDTHFIKEFTSASSNDILRFSELKFPSLAIITEKVFHDEKLELITEVGDMGSLKQFISEYGCSMENAMTYLSQIAEALLFLHRRRFIHRNLHTNAVFVYWNGNVKLACFARVRKLMPNAADESSPIPVHLPMHEETLRWSSPEVMTDGEYSKASDMWAFGVLIWETFTLIDKHDEGDESDQEIIPYDELTTKDQILSYLKNGRRLGKPNNCPDWLYELMLRCWELNTHDRATAQDIVQCININQQILEYSSSEYTIPLETT